MLEAHASDPEVRRALRNAGTPRHALRGFRTGSGLGGRGPVERVSRPQHRVQDCGELACDGDAFEAGLFPELQAPGAQVTFNPARGQDPCGGLAEEPAKASIAAPGDMAVVIDLSRLASAGRQARPGADRAGPPEVRRILDGGDE